MKEDFSSHPPSETRADDPANHFTELANRFIQRTNGTFWICLLLFGLTVLTFFPSLKTDFQFNDENAELLNNTHVNSGLGWQNLRWALFSLEYANWYPLTWISHMLDFQVFGNHPWGHHLTNVLLHAANGVLLFLVLKRMTGTLWRSLVVASLFALHPLRVESVTWITERKDVLSVFFGLMVLWTYARYVEASKTQRDKPKLFYGLTVLFFAFGLMSKSMWVTLPCLLLLLDFWPLERWRMKSKWSLVMEKVPFFLLVVPVCMATYFAQKGGEMFILHLPLGFRLETALMGYARYLGKMIWPVDFSVLYPYPDFWPVSQLLSAATLVFGISVFVFVLRRQHPHLLVGWLWYLGTLIPVIGLIPLGWQSMGNRYTYIPMIGILLLVVWTVGDLSKQWRGRIVLITTIAALTVGACILRTRAEIAYWKNSETLWRRAVAVTKNNFTAHWCLGNLLYQTNPDEALAEFQKCVTIYPNLADDQRGEAGLAFLLEKSGHFSDAVVHYEKAIQLDPQNSWACHGLGWTLLQLDRAGDAVLPLLTAIEIDPQNASYKDDLGFVLYSGGHETGAVSNFLAAAWSDPTGFASFLDAMQHDTNHVALMNNMAWAFASNPDPKLRNGKYAVRLATRACEMTGFQTTVYVGTLSAAYAEDSRFDDAVSSAQLACSLSTIAGQQELLKKNQELLELFRSHRPYHESIKEISH
jgi:Tfp pilus assembly protein PilF